MQTHRKLCAGLRKYSYPAFSGTPYFLKCNPLFMQEVHILIRFPLGRVAHCRLGYLRLLPVGLYLSALTLLL